MDIAALAIGLKQAQLQQAVGTSVLKLALDSAQTSGDALTQMLHTSGAELEKLVQPSLGGRLDIKI